MKKLLVLLLVFVLSVFFVLSQTTDTVKSVGRRELNMENYVWFGLGLGGGLHGFAVNGSLFYSYFGLGFSYVRGDQIPDEIPISKFYTQPYDHQTSKKYSEGWFNYELLGKFPIVRNRLYFVGCLGYYQFKSLIQTEYTDKIYDKARINSDKKTELSGISYGAGFLARVSDQILIGISYKNETGVLVDFCFVLAGFWN